MIFDPQLDSIEIESEVVWQGTPDELLAYLIANELKRGCLVWSSVAQEKMSGHDYIRRFSS